LLQTIGVILVSVAVQAYCPTETFVIIESYHGIKGHHFLIFARCKIFNPKNGLKTLATIFDSNFNMLAFLPLVVFGSLVTSVVSRAVTNIGLSQFPQAIYTLANDETGAYVVSLAISENGKISAPVKTSTRGRGLLGVQATGVNKRDGLFGQDAIVVAGNVYLFNGLGSLECILT
jgi:hypothetical protein